MKRVQLFEFEDFPWFPTWMRSSMTNLIVLLHRMMGIAPIIADLLAEVLQREHLGQIVDLGSGSGGPMPEVIRLIRGKEGLENTKLLLSDRYPNPDFVRRFNQTNPAFLQYIDRAIDAAQISETPPGLKTLVNSFHHMPPNVAREILQSAKENRQPLLIYEMAENKMPLFLWIILLPVSLCILFIMVLFMTPFVRPLTWQQLVFTYLIPIIPICYAWDGQASLPRIYGFADLDQLLEGLSNEGYTWRKGPARNRKGQQKGIYLLGMPVA